MDIAKLFKIKLAALQRITKELQYTRETRKREDERLDEIEKSTEYDSDERPSRVEWQRKVVNEHQESIFETEERLSAAIEDVENCLKGLKAAHDADMTG
eukprot:CAMPEP_0201523428 /NCGR_PEP_ID=MMETSP0161_2-20130828/19840_1 /ASSEMBLY_ACC=CAM_ASM_000251 /TAXON_ID=180227 /ORGANISM="Neoparamoeba aestuarina, Strain SoJaBio B1-5/56/2" /LENGTH=98 /DNA_ID=CAMNT_0047922543 /DNA_START=29 /DNA_END=321 /DNA_ORIENTATION=-